MRRFEHDSRVFTVERDPEFHLKTVFLVHQIGPDGSSRFIARTYGKTFQKAFDQFVRLMGNADLKDEIQARLSK